MKGKIKAHGKCILLGEHSVVRGAPALVFPLRSLALELEWEKSEGEGREIEGDVPFFSALDRALEILGQRLPEGKWKFRVENKIPVRAGLGSSAALAVAVVKFLQAIELPVPSPFALCVEIEDLFHGKSSGIDIAGALAETPLLFVRGRQPEPVSLAWRPFLYLSDSQLRSPTARSVQKVTDLARDDLDDRMSLAVSQAKSALSLRSPEALRQLQSAMEEGAACFQEWGLVPPAMQELALELKAKGALAVKPTGSGDGGFLLSLWDRPQPELTPLAEDFSAYP